MNELKLDKEVQDVYVIWVHVESNSLGVTTNEKFVEMANKHFVDYVSGTQTYGEAVKLAKRHAYLFQFEYNPKFDNKT